MALGSSVATLSTMGVAIAGIAQVFNLSPALIGGALISGAMVGDRTSPVSGTFHLVAHMTETKAEDNYKPMWQTGIPMIVLCILLFFYLGYGKAFGSLDPMSHPLLKELILHFQMPWYVLIPPYSGAHIGHVSCFYSAESRDRHHIGYPLRRHTARGFVYVITCMQSVIIRDCAGTNSSFHI
jgi:hypothetical protein